MHIVFIWIFFMIKLNIRNFVYEELKTEISNEF
ncbi:serine kinase [Bacillus anthracis]|nr:serine kinase [Bacillus anthracis]